MHTKGEARGTEQHQYGKQDGRYFSKTLQFGESLIRIYGIYFRMFDFNIKNDGLYFKYFNM